MTQKNKSCISSSLRFSVTTTSSYIIIVNCTINTTRTSTVYSNTNDSIIEISQHRRIYYIVSGLFNESFDKLTTTCRARVAMQKCNGSIRESSRDTYVYVMNS